MKITTERLPAAQVKLTVEPDPSQVDEALRKAATKISKNYNVPGFRKGKAPYAAVVRAYGKQVLYEQVVEDMGDKVYKQALEESGLKPIAPGVLEDVTFDPLVYHLVLPMAPEVDLGDYRSVRVDRPAVEVTDEEVQAQLLEMQEKQAEWLPLEGELAAFGDLVTMKLSGVVVEDEEFFYELDETGGDGEFDGQDEDDELNEEDFDEDEDDEFDEDDGEDFDDADDEFDDDRPEIVSDDAFELILQETSEDFPPGFDAQFLGKQAGEVLSFDLVYPEDWPSDRAGVKAHFEAEIHSVKRRDVPELDDDFAALVGDYDTLDQLKASIREGMVKERQTEADNAYANTVVDKMIEGAAKIEYPPVLVDDAVERMMQEQDHDLRRSGLPLKEFLRLTGQNEQTYRQRIKGAAEKRLRSDLVLDKLVEVEHLHATPEEIEAHTAELLEASGDEVESMRELLANAGSQAVLAHDIERRKAIERMMAIADGTAPEPVEAEEQAEAEAKVEEVVSSTEAEAEAEANAVETEAS